VPPDRRRVGMSKTPHPTSASRRSLGSVAGHSAVGGSGSPSPSWDKNSSDHRRSLLSRALESPSAATARVKAAASRFRRGSSGDLEALPASPGGSGGGSPRSGAFGQAGVSQRPLGSGSGSGHGVGGGVGGGGGVRQRAAAAAMEDVGAPGSLARSAHIRAMLMQVLTD